MKPSGQTTRTAESRPVLTPGGKTGGGPMNSRNIRFEKKEDVYTVLMTSSTERLKKARALNCSPAYLGIDSQLCRKLFSIKCGMLTKI